VSGMHDDRERLTEALSAYLDDALDSAERDTLERHLATCETCRAELAGLRRVGALLRALPEPALPRSFTLPATTPRSGKSGAPRRAPVWARPAQWAGGLAAALGAGLLVAGIIHPTYGGALNSNAPNRQGVFSQGGASSATTPSHSPTYDQNTGAVTASPPPAGAGSVPSQEPTPTYGPEYQGASENQGAGSPLVPTGATLLVGGGAALAAGTVSRRRTRRQKRAR
jgi:anti-sigma factor RsiW